MTEEISIFKCGQEIRTKIGKIEGVITATCIRGNSITYELSYFKDGEHKTTWISDVEIDYTFERTYTSTFIGFKQNGENKL